MAAVADVTTRPDSAINQDVILELKWDPKITSNDIAVAVKDGVVTLSGFASNFMEKDAAEKAAKRVYGVGCRANDIQIKLSSTRTDPEVARDAVHELESHVLIPADKIKVTVRNGWVTLEGNVDWQFQKNLAESSVKKLKGVIGITNNIQVKPKITPTQVKEKIEEALKRSAEIDARRVTVDLEGTPSNSMAVCAPGRRRRRRSAQRGPRQVLRRSKTTFTLLRSKRFCSARSGQLLPEIAPIQTVLFLACLLERGDRYGKGNRDRLRNNELGGGGDGGRQAHRDHQQRGQPADTFGGGLHQRGRTVGGPDWPSARRCSIQKTPSIRRSVSSDAASRRCSPRSRTCLTKWLPGPNDAVRFLIIGQAIFAGGNLVDDPAPAGRRCSQVPGRKGDRRGDHRARLFQ